MTGRSRKELVIFFQQVLLADASVYSVQWLTLPARQREVLDAVFVYRRYLSYLQRCTLHLIAPRERGDVVEFRLRGTSLSLLSFSGPRCDIGPAPETVTLRIGGGLLVQPGQCDRGQLVFGVEALPEGVKVTVELSDYCPLLLGSSKPSRLRKLLYRLTQAALHRVVTINFLSHLCRELEGAAGRIRVLPVLVRPGEDI